MLLVVAQLMGQAGDEWNERFLTRTAQNIPGLLAI